MIKVNPKGLATKFLTRLETERVALRVVDYGFNLPSNDPVILIALGTGIAPFLGIFEENLISNSTNKNLILFFGFQHQADCKMILSKLQDFQSKGIISRIFTAFSRDTPNSSHVQDEIESHSKDFWEVWQDPKTSLFICGPDNGASDQIKISIINVTVQEGKLNPNDAKVFYSKHPISIQAF